MEKYIPACKIYDNEDFSFEAEIVEDDDTGELGIQIKNNVRCDTCFLLEECFMGFDKKFTDAFGLKRQDVLNDKARC